VPSTIEESGGLNSGAWRDIQDCASRLEISLRTNADTADLRHFLPPPGTPHSLAVLHELIKTYLEHLFRQRRGCLLEEFLGRYPELGGAANLPAGLIFEEYRCRWKFGDCPAVEEYAKRFPSQFEAFRTLVRREPQRRPAGAADSTCRDETSPIARPAITPPGGRGTLTPSVHVNAPPPPRGPAPDPPAGDGTLMLSGGEGYKLLQRIGKGEFGEVFRALAPGGVTVALKRIFRPMNDETCQRELRALKKVSEIRHPFLLQTHNFQAFGDHLVIVMELADGSLLDRLNECRAAGLPGIPLDELLRYFMEAAEALDFLCREKLSHRDIKPANLLQVKGHAKVADFGIARPQEASVDHTLNFAGTPAYMPPEVWGKEIHIHSDQYSFAATWFEMRTSKRAFPGLSPFEVGLQHFNGHPDLSGVPEEEQKVLLKALAKDPEQRYSSCTEFVRELGRASEPPAPKPVRGRFSLMTATLAAVCLGVLVAVLVSVRKPSAPERNEPTPSPVDWLPSLWQPASADEERVEDPTTGRHYYRRIQRNFDTETVMMILVPRANPSDPPTFYMMQNKVWNDLYRVFLDSPVSNSLLQQNSRRDSGCQDLVKGEWGKGAKDGAYSDLGAGPERGRIPVFRATATEGECVAEWMQGRLPTLEQYLKAAGLKDIPAPAIFDSDGEGLAINLKATGPWTVDEGDRDVIGGCRQLVTNGEEFTRTLQEVLPGEDPSLPLREMKAHRRVYIVGQSYLAPEPPRVEKLREINSIDCTQTRHDIGFRVVLEEPKPNK
jgi:serine/threonine protein kinase